MFLPCMTSTEVTCFLKYLEKCTTYLEYGSGGSTTLASKFPIQIVAIDSDKAWLSNLERQINSPTRPPMGRMRKPKSTKHIEGMADIANCAIRQKLIDLYKQPCRANLKLEYVDIGPTGAWGVPTPDNIERDKWRTYSNPIPDFHPDLIMVDGRFRVACALKCWSIMDETHTLLLHDCDRPEYKPIDEYFTKVEQKGRLCVYRKNINIEAPSADVITQFEVISL